MESRDLVSAPLTSVEEQPEMIFSTDTCNDQCYHGFSLATDRPNSRYFSWCLVEFG